MSHHHRRHEREVVKSARWMLLGIFLMLRIPDVACYYYSFNPIHPNPVIRGHIIVSVLWTGTFLSLLCMRRIWARYVMIIFLGYVAFISGIVVSMLILLPDILLGPSIALTGGF